jgi:ABC-2 type transport system permease protein
VAEYNPLTYLVNALRSLMIQSDAPITGLGTDLLILTVVFVALVAIGARLYEGIVR